MSRKSSFGFVFIAAATAASVFACAYEVGPPVSVDGESPPGAPSVAAARSNKPLPRRKHDKFRLN